MNTLTKRALGAAVTLSLALAGAGAQASVVTTIATTHSGFTVGTTDLLAGRTGTITGNVNSEEGLDSNTDGAALTDGAFGTVDIDYHSNPGMIQIHNGVSITYTLGADPLGYSISAIDSYTGWRDNGRYQQDYTVQFAFVGAPTSFVDAFSVAQDPSTDFDAYVSSFDGTQTNSPLASHVTAVRFNFANVQNGYVGYRELDVLGAATVPEPASLMLFGLAAIGLVAARRRVSK